MRCDKLMVDPLGFHGHLAAENLVDYLLLTF